MNNYLIKVEYDGTNYVGWQYQKNGVSIQEIIEKVLKKILKANIKITGAGRPDKGVHANCQFAHFKIEKKIFNKKKFLNSVNFFLKENSISILDIKKKKKNFHARFSAKERTYSYLIINRIAALSLDKNRAWHLRKKLDVNLLKKGTKILQGTHDFSTFRASTCSAKSPVKKINSISIKKDGDKILITIKSKSFLQNQVRSMIGCLTKLSSKEWSIKKFKTVFKSKKRVYCASPAPACGLYLKNVKY